MVYAKNLINVSVLLHSIRFYTLICHADFRSLYDVFFNLVNIPWAELCNNIVRYKYKKAGEDQLNNLKKERMALKTLAFGVYSQ